MGRGSTSPCHQGHQQGQEDQWDQSDLGRHLCQEHHQHLWDQHRPTNMGQPEMCSVEQGGGLVCLAGVWDPAPPLPSSALSPCPGPKTFLRKRCLQRARGPALGRGMSKGFPHPSPLVAKATHGERRAWTTDRGFMSKQARGEDGRAGGEAEGSRADREGEPHRLGLTLSPLGPGRPAAPRSPGIP